MISLEKNQRDAENTEVQSDEEQGGSEGDKVI